MPRKWKFRKYRQGMLIAFLSAVLLVFMVFMYLFKKENSPLVIFKELKQENYIREVTNWQATFEHCTIESLRLSCKNVGEYFYNLVLPDIGAIKKLVTSIEPRPNRVTLTHSLSEETIQWLKNTPSDFSIVLPSMLHERTDLYQGKSLQKAFGTNVDVIFSINKKQLLNDQKIKLRTFFFTYDSFGPQNELPIALVQSSKLYIYSNLTTRNTMTALVLRAQEFTVFLLIVAMAFVLDHSLSFWLLSFYTVGRATRAFIPFLSEMNFVNNIGMDIIYIVANSIMVVGLPLFIATFFNMKWKRTTPYYCMVGVGSLLFAYYYTVPNAVIYMDLYADTFAAVCAITIIGLGIYKMGMHVGKNKQSQEKQKDYIGISVKYIRALALLCVLIITAWVNLEDILFASENKFQDFLDWRHTILLPSLIIAALLEVGSTSKALIIYSNKMIRQALMEKDLEMGKEVQQEMLPTRKFTGKFWNWRTFYFPATHLGGDWFDLREIEFADGKMALVTCLADVTGHGVGAAMMTSTISSNWGQWCKKLSGTEYTYDAEERDKLVMQAVIHIHEGLLALRCNKGCSLAVSVFFPDNNALFFSTPGHTGIVLERSQKIQYLISKGPRLGGKFNNFEVKNISVEPGDSIYIYSDGIVTPKQITSQWLKRSHREAVKQEVPLIKVLMSGMRTNKRLFREQPKLEDDMTLVVYSIEDTRVTNQKINATA